MYCYLRLVVVTVSAGPENGRRSVPHLRTFVLVIGRETAPLYAMFNPVFFQCRPPTLLSQLCVITLQRSSLVLVLNNNSCDRRWRSMIGPVLITRTGSGFQYDSDPSVDWGSYHPTNAIFDYQSRCDSYQVLSAQPAGRCLGSHLVCTSYNTSR